MPSITLFVPAATGAPVDVVNAGHEIKAVPEAGTPSARYTFDLCDPSHDLIRVLQDFHFALFVPPLAPFVVKLFSAALYG